MTFEQMMQRAIFQYNADWDDYEDYAPHVDAYVNDGYDQVLHALTKYHLDDLPVFPTLEAEADAEVEPKVPQWTHLPICDYATYMLYRNGNPQKQQRGQEFLRNFMKCLSRCEELSARTKVDTATGAITVDEGSPVQFHHVYP